MAGSLGRKKGGTGAKERGVGCCDQVGDISRVREVWMCAGLSLRWRRRGRGQPGLRQAG